MIRKPTRKDLEQRIRLIEEEAAGAERLQTELWESEERYRTIIDISPDPIIMYDLKGRILTVNMQTAKTYGVSSVEEFLGEVKTVFDLLIDEGKAFAVANLCRTLVEGVSQKNEYLVRLRDGRTIAVEINSSIVRTGNGEPRAFISVIRDITDSKRAQEALQKSEEKYRTMIENMEEGYIEVDLAGRLTFFNESARKFLGYSKEETMGMPYEKYTDKENAERVFKLYNEVYRTRVPKHRFEWEVIRRDGERRAIEGSASLMSDDEGRPVGFRSLFRDVTDRQNLQQEHEQLRDRLYRAEKMEALGTLAGGVAHDLNNVLGVLVGYSELLADQLPASSPLKRHADNILQSSIRGAAIIQDLLTLARRGVAVSEIVNLNRVVSDYFKTPEYEKLRSEHREAKIRTELTAGLLNIKGSPVHLSKTIANLVTNAAEAMSGRGEITIRTENRYLDVPVRGYDEMREGDYVVLTVSDTGIGISADDIGKIFEPFYTKKVMGRSGTGLGLAVVWGTVKDHDGYVDVRSEEDKGSTFTLYFPATREKAMKEERVVDAAAYRGRGETILVVDDVKEQRELAISMLGRLGYRVEAVAGGEEAIGYLKGNKADLIVLDMIMEPGMDGMETYRRILEINPAQKAIIVSGFSETDRVREAHEMGAGEFVRKPYILERIGLAVRKELDRK